MRPLTRNYLMAKFREYYLAASRDAPTRIDSPRLESREWSLMLPPDLGSREWGFMFFDESGMRRHKSFLSQGELVDYLLGMVPAHVYYSAAYYQRPAAPTMKEKLWQGADLIFDLDADHLKKAPRSYAQMLDLVKKETLKLLGFLIDDFGFAEQSISVVFSGGRGYHIHVRDRRVFSLGSSERREIVDYLAGRGLEIERLITKRLVSGDSGVKEAKVLTCPQEGAPGWRGRLNRAIVSFAEDLQELDREEAIIRLSSLEGIGPANASRFYSYIQDERALEQIRGGNLDGMWKISGVWKEIFKRCITDEGVAIGFSLDEERGETDEPVTADVRRLIRCPTSLHGGSGLRVTPLSLQALEEFDPLWDAVVFGEDPVAVDVLRPFSTEMIGQSYNLQEGRTELPACVAVFLMARGAAELGRAADR
jgi:DNA primase small subunit